MRNLMLVARREYLEQIRGRAFRVTTILIPLLFGMVIFIIMMTSRGLASGKHVVVTSTDVALAGEIGDQLAHDESNSRVQVEAPVSPGDRAALVDRVRTGKIDGFLWVDAGPGKMPTAVYESQSSGDLITQEQLSAAVNRALVRGRLTTSGIQAGVIDGLLKDVDVDTLQINKRGKELRSNALSSFWKGYVMAFLLSTTTMIYGMNVARSIIQEKTSRIFEVMLATARPSDLLWGKLIGVGTVGLTQIAIWLAVGGAVAGAFAGQIFTAKLSLHFSWEEGILFPVYFVLGYLLYASLFAGLAASCETEQELQMYTPLAVCPSGWPSRSSSWWSTIRILRCRWRLRSSRLRRRSS